MSRRTLSLCLLLTACEVDPDPLPPRVTLIDNARMPEDGPSVPIPTPMLRVVGDAELEVALDGVAKTLPFSDYPYSGCHDRAHATWLALSARLGADAAAKIWVFAPRLLTVALDGAVGIPVDRARWGESETKWDYHVAVVFETEAGLRIIDPRVGEGFEPVTLDAWFGNMSIDPGAAWTIADGRYYSFNKTGEAPWSGGRRPFNGGLFEYDRTAHADGWLFDDLARDDAASVLADDPEACPSLSVQLDDPGALLDAFRHPGPGCATVHAAYTSSRARWQARLDPLL